MMSQNQTAECFNNERPLLLFNYCKRFFKIKKKKQSSYAFAFYVFLVRLF